jgi:predicted dehydrogenase
MTTKRIRVGILGVHPDKGWATLAHVPALRSLSADYEIVALTSNSYENARRAAQKLDIPHALATTAELVTHPEVDLVVVTVKVSNHFELATAVISAGKAVYCEWPLGVDLEQAEAIATLARSKNVHTTIGLQTRAAPVFNYVRDMIRGGYVGDVISTTLIGSGISWGESLEERFRYAADSKSGAGMLHVTFAHSLDAVLYALDAGFEKLSANLTIRRATTRMAESGDIVALRTPDQIVVSGTLTSGAFLATHFRGGLSKGTNFHWEINGSKGDLIVTSPVGYVGVGGFRLQGVNEHTLQDLTIPPEYGDASPTRGVEENVALLYERLATDLSAESHLSPSFEDAVALHRLIDRIERGARE